MERMRQEGAYLPLGLFDGREIRGYALLWKDLGDRRFLLFDYLAVPRAARGQGLGAEIIRQTLAYYPPDTVIFGESEAPDGGAEDAQRKRRLAFYERAGARPAGYEVGLYGVRFAVVCWAAGEVDAGELMLRHRAIYRRHMPKALFEQYVRIPLRPGEDPGPLTVWDEEREAEEK